MLIIGHRGMPTRQIAENTLLSFKQAVAAGADGIEFDVRLSKDNKLVIGHDPDLSRIAGSAQKYRGLTAKELKAVILRGAGSIITLNEVTEQIEAPLILDMEIKDVRVMPLLIAKLKTSKQLRERTIISSFELRAIFQAKRDLPDVRRMVLLHTWSALLGVHRAYERILALRPWAVGARLGMLTQRRMRWLRSHGILVATYDKANSNLSTRRIVNKGVDIAITYRPGYARKVLHEIK